MLELLQSWIRRICALGARAIEKGGRSVRLGDIALRRRDAVRLASPSTTEEGVYSVKVHGCSYAYDYEERAVDVLDCLYERSKNLMRCIQDSFATPDLQ